MAAKKITHLSVDEPIAEGADARGRTPPSSHRGWRPAEDWPDRVALLEQQNTARGPDLVPVRHGRMMVSPFTFYRGAAKIMAAGLKDTPAAGLVVQLCGGARLSNFGVFASPERTLWFDLNDFDETFPGSFECDVKRMSASFTSAAGNNGFSKADTRASVAAEKAHTRDSLQSLSKLGELVDGRYRIVCAPHAQQRDCRPSSGQSPGEQSGGCVPSGSSR